MGCLAAAPTRRSRGNLGQKPRALRLRQIRKLAEVTAAVDLHHIDAAWPTFHSGLHQT
jgi:hypothetical protein